MPYKANEARRHRIPRARYRVTNWPAYDGALQRRGSLTVLGHAGGARGLASTPEWPAGPAARLLGGGDRDRAPAAPGLRPALAADRRPAALAGQPARPGRRH